MRGTAGCCALPAVLASALPAVLTSATAGEDGHGQRIRLSIMALGSGCCMMKRFKWVKLIIQNRPVTTVRNGGRSCGIRCLYFLVYTLVPDFLVRTHSSPFMSKG